MNFQSIYPRSVYGQPYGEEFQTKTGAITTGGSFADLAALGMFGTQRGTTYWNASRRFYDPQITTTAIYLPRSIKQKNRWRRWFYDHDELVGAVLDIHAELPYSKAEIMCDDNLIKTHVLDCFDRTQFFSMLPLIDLEYLKVGEVFIHTPWDAKRGMWSHIIIHNPDFVQVSASPFADQEYTIELIPDDELRNLLNSTKPQDQLLKKRISPEIVRRVLSGKNILLDTDEVTHIARRSNPYDIRGTSILDRIFRLLMYEDKLREAQITIADNFIYPLKIFKLGDPHKGWIPNETHQKALAQMLQQSTFDPNFALIYHYALDVSYVTVADKVMKLDREWDEIAKKKMIALGVSQQFITGETSYATANVGLQTQLARYRAKRDLFEVRWITNKFLKVMAERNGWYKRDRREIVGHFRVARSGKELEERLIIPKLVWHKKLMMRDDQAFLTFMNNVYAQGKGPISALTLLQAMGLDLEDELSRKKFQEKLEEKIGVYIQPPAVGPLGTVTAKVGNWWNRRKNKTAKKEQTTLDLNGVIDADESTFTGAPDIEVVYSNVDSALQKEADLEKVTLGYIDRIDENAFSMNLRSQMLPPTVSILIKTARDYSGEIVRSNKAKFVQHLENLYMQGKLLAYSKTNFVPYTEHKELKDYSDILLCKSFEDWIDNIIIGSKDNNISSKNAALAIAAFLFGQLKGYQEQGIFHVKVSNVYKKDGEIFNTKDLLKLGSNVAFLLSPELEVPIFIPCIESFDGEDFDNQVDQQIQRRKTIFVDSVKVTDCPIEIVDEVRNLLTKLNSLFSKKHGIENLIFVHDIVNLPEWEQKTRETIKKSLDASLEEKSLAQDFLLESRLQQQKIMHRGQQAIFVDGKKVYVACWVLQQPKSFTKIFLDGYPLLDDENITKMIRKSFTPPSYNLSKEEIDSYLALGYIDPVYLEDNTLVGYRFSNIDSTRIDTKLVEGKVWSVDGKCSYVQQKDALDYFSENLYKWILYPHLLDRKIYQSFESMGS